MQSAASKKAHPASEDIGRLRRLVSLAPQDIELRLALARALMDSLRSDEAVQEIRAVIALAPNNLEARKLLHAALVHQERTP